MQTSVDSQLSSTSLLNHPIFKELEPEEGGVFHRRVVGELKEKTPYYLRTAIVHTSDRHLAALVLLQKIVRGREDGTPIEGERACLKTILAYYPLYKNVLNELFPPPPET